MVGFANVFLLYEEGGRPCIKIKHHDLVFKLYDFLHESHITAIMEGGTEETLSWRGIDCVIAFDKAIMRNGEFDFCKISINLGHKDIISVSHVFRVSKTGFETLLEASRAINDFD
jgi:hypothetical protein